MTLRWLIVTICLSFTLANCFGGRSQKQIVPNDEGGSEERLPNSGGEGSSDDGIGASEKDNDPSISGDDESSAASNKLSPEQLSNGKTYLAGWDGLRDEADSQGRWQVRTINAPESGGGGGVGGASTGGGTVFYQPDIANLLSNNCTGCHSRGGSRATSAMDTYQGASQWADSSLSRVRSGNMPPNGGLSPQAKVAFENAFEAWISGQKPESAGGAGGGVPGGPNANNPNENPNEVRYVIPAGTGRGPWPGTINGRIGQTLIIVNEDSVAHLPHTDGAPFPHPNPAQPVQPGTEQRYQLRQSFNGRTYDHIQENNTGNPTAVINWQISR